MIELRCPITNHLFGKVDRPVIVEGNLIELACLPCRNAARKDRSIRVRLILHHFNVVGDCVESETVLEDQHGAGERVDC